MLKVLMANDDLTPMEFVVLLLERFFEKSTDEATKIMLRVHHEGEAACGVYPAARARELLSDATAFARKHGHPLQLSLADADTGQAS
jgi:ATP-dependent Clp protease adaptor protein ClpS